MPAAPKKTAASAKASRQFHAVVGTDEGEVKRVAAELARELANDESGEFGLEVIDGAADIVDEAVEALQTTLQSLETLPFFGAKVVWLKSATFFSDTVVGGSERVLELAGDLIDLLKAGLPDGVTFILSATDVDKRRSFWKQLGKLTDPHVFDRPNTSRPGWEDAVARQIAQQARERGFSFEPRALDLFVMLAGADSRQLRNELEKIHAFLGDEEGGTVTLQDVRALVPRSTAGIVFELGNALGRRDAAEAVYLTEDLLEQGENPLGLLFASIVPTVRNMLLARDLMDRFHLRKPHRPNQFASALNSLSEDDCAHLPRKKDGSLSTWSLGMAAMDAHNYTVQELREALLACAEANLQLVSTQLDARVVLTTLVASIISGKR
jgi:DNA polymerase-3 subunit delta